MRTDEHPVPASQTPPKPSPGLVRSIGVFNLLVGGVLLLGGCWYAWVMTPFLRENTPMRIDSVLADDIADAMKQQIVLDLRAAERSASDETQKAKIREDREKIEAQKTKIQEQVDFEKINADLYWLAPYFWADVTTGPVLNLLLVVSGIGLIACANWSRKLAIGVVALKIVRLVVLCVILVGLVVPAMGRVVHAIGGSELGESLLRALLIQASQILHASVSMSASEIVQAMTWLGYGFSVVMLGFGSIYPTIVLLVLSRPSARLTCTRKLAERTPS